MVSRRSALRSAVALLGAPFINRGRFDLFAATTASTAGVAAKDAAYSVQTIDLVRESSVIDMLGLLTLDYKKLGTWTANPHGCQPAELERLKNYGITIFHPAVGFTDCDIYEKSLKDITGWNMFIAGHS